jgi:hypothetical protein
MGRDAAGGKVGGTQESKPRERDRFDAEGGFDFESVRHEQVNGRRKGHRSSLSRWREPRSWGAQLVKKINKSKNQKEVFRSLEQREGSMARATGEEP